MEKYQQLFSKDLISNIFNQMPGYFLLKDLNSVYVAGNRATAKLFGFNKCKQLAGITDYDIKCEAANHASLFIKQDETLKKTGNNIQVLDIHTYANKEIKVLLINKSLLKEKNGKIALINCYCVELTNQFISSIAYKLTKDKSFESKHNLIKESKHYYLNQKYGDLKLSKRQSQCMFYLLRGKTASMIAILLNLSTRTVESYIEEIKYKMGCNSKTQIIEKSIMLGFVEIIPDGILDQNDYLININYRKN